MILRINKFLLNYYKISLVLIETIIASTYFLLFYFILSILLFLFSLYCVNGTFIFYNYLFFFVILISLLHGFVGIKAIIDDYTFNFISKLVFSTLIFFICLKLLIIFLFLL